MDTFTSPGIRDWHFNLVFHGSRVQLEGHHAGETISRWPSPTESIDKAAYNFLTAPTCCLL